MRRALEAVLTTAHTFVFAMLPMLLVLSSYGGPFEITFETTKSFAIIAGAVVAVLVALQPLGGSLAARAAATSATVIALSGYRTVVQLAAPGYASTLIERPLVAGAFVVGAILVGVAVRRPWDPSPRRTPLLSTLAMAMLIVGTGPAIWSAFTAHAHAWRAEADRLVEAAPASFQSTTPERDVYVIVLDGLGRGDVLRNLYGVDATPLEAYLRASGFHVPDRARAPYSQTELSIPALLNMDYLDSVASAAGRGTSDRSPMQYLLARNGMMAAARRAGYDVVSVGSEFGPTREFRDARVVGGAFGGLGELQQEAMKMTPLAALPLNRWTHGAHRDNVLQQFAALDAIAREPAPARRLVFAYVVAPHPPFVFNANGSARTLDTNWLAMGDGDLFEGSEAAYVQGYSAQARFILAKLEDVVRAILRQPGPTPAILITGDHGPGSQLRWEDPHASNMTERMGIFAAYRFPGVDAQDFTPALSPVAAARILANRYFGTNLPQLPDRSAFSTWTRPYDFLQLPPAAAN